MTPKQERTFRELLDAAKDMLDGLSCATRETIEGEVLSNKITAAEEALRDEPLGQTRAELDAAYLEFHQKAVEDYKTITGRDWPYGPAR